MPELPEVETTVKGLNKNVLGKTIVGVWSDWQKIIKRPKSFADFEKKIKGKKIIKAWRRAKNVIVDLSDDYSLLVHQKMTGHLLFGRWKLDNGKWAPEERGPMDDMVNRFIHVVFLFDTGDMLALSDLRKFAKVELWKTDELLQSDNIKNLGPEPLSADFTFAKFKNLFKDKKGKVKQVLMNQAIISGIGNIYSDEALWQSKINPLKAVSKLEDKELKKLYNSIIFVLKKGVELGGESFADYRNIEGKKGEFDNERMAYQREGEKCSRCGEEIKRIKIGGRSAHFCPVCQKL